MLGVPADAIEAAERSSAAPSVFTVRAPIAGALVALDARDGMSLSAGAPLASISGLSPVWLIVSVPQSSIGGLVAGDAASAAFPSFPGKQFAGRVDAILPGANATNRTLEVRIALANGDGRLRPGMTGDVTFTGAVSRQALTVPSEAVIRTGQRTVVIVAHDDDGFEPTDVTLGTAAGDRLEILSGLSEGQRVVASGQFLIDSEANLTGVLERLRGASPTMPMTDYEATGKVTAIDAAGVTLAHSPVPQLNWPEMTMAFGWGDVPRDVAIGDEVEFSFLKGGAGYVLTSIRKTGAPR
jgi:Cu(I)/Ag(I) efflux system membrane fusion protein